jgi:hypothetical protein
MGDQLMRRALLALVAALALAPAAHAFTGSHKYPVAGPVDPAWVGGLKEEFFADAGCKNASATTCADGDTVASWADQSGNGNNISCSTGPVYHAAQLNSLPAITGNGSNEYCTRTSTDDVGTLILVAKLNTSYGSFPGAYEAYIGADSGASAASGAYAVQAFSNTTTYSPNGAYLPTTFYHMKSGETGYTPAVKAGMPPRIGMWWAVGARLNASRIAIYDGTNLVLSAAASGTPATPTNPVLFADYAAHGVVDECGCSIAAMLHYDPDISDAQFAGVMLWLAGRYALQPSGAYLMTTFQNTTAGQELLELQSADGVNFTYRPSAYLPLATAGPSGYNVVVRDPSFYTDQAGKLATVNGYYWLFHTSEPYFPSNPASDSIAVAKCLPDPYESDYGPTDCTYVEDIDLSGVTGSSGLAWAPKPYMDGSGGMHVLVSLNSSLSAGVGAGFPYEIHPSTSDPGGAWSSPVQLTGTSLPAATLDSRLVFDGTGTRYIFTSHDGSTAYNLFTSTSDLSGYALASNSNCYNGEAPDLLLIKSLWHFYADNFGSGLYYCTGGSLAAPAWSGATAFTGSNMPFRGVAPQVTQIGALPPAPAFAGAGDVVSGALAYWGLRAYSAATRGAKLVNACYESGGSDTGCADLSSDATTGILDAGVVDGTHTCPGASCTIKTFYDLTGNGHDATQATVANRAALTAACLGTNPCAVFSGGQYYVASGNVTQAQPLTYSSVFQPTSSVNGVVLGTEQTDYGAPLLQEANSSGLKLRLYAGSILDVAGALDGWYAFQGVFDGASSASYINGTTTSGAGGSDAMSGAPFCVGGTNNASGCAANYLNGRVLEMGAWGGAFTGTQAANMNADQHGVWGF